MTVPVQQLNNYVQTTLASGCTSIATVLTLTSLAGLPTSGNFMLRIDDALPATTFEWVEVTSVNIGASQVTATRGQEGTSPIAHSSGAAVGNKLSAAMLLRALPRGVLPGGYAEVQANQSPVTALTDLTNLTITITADGTRRVKITAYVALSSTVGSDTVALFIREGGTTLAGSYIAINASSGAGFNAPLILSFVPTAGSHTYKLTAQRIAGTGIIGMIANANNPAYILAEDIGGYA